MMPNTITIRRPDDWHVHLRDGDMLATVLPFTAAQFRRAIIMPNLVPPVTTSEAASAYRRRIMAALPAGADFEPLMTCYLTDATDADELARGHAEGLFVAAKLYPAGATTNAHHGVTDLSRIDAVLARMERIGMPLLVRGESTDPAVDIFDRERVFMERQLEPLLRRHQGLRVVMEHITTAEAASFVPEQSGRVGATITPHHLMINRNALFAGGLRPHAYCLPVAKREKHRLALRKAATSGASCFFLGTDTAPHRVSAKEADCGCAGIFNAPVALECYAQVFDAENALEKLEAFASLNGPRFYRLAPNDGTVTLRRRPSLVASEVGGPDGVRPFLAGEETAWSLEPSE
jgi:dihydroorotase